MAVNYETRYPGNVDEATTEYPFGKPRNDSIPEAADGTPADEAWVSDWAGFCAAVLTAVNDSATNDPETATDSQILEGIRRAIGGENLWPRAQQTAGTETLGQVTAETTLDDTDWKTEFVGRLLFGGVYRVSVDHQTPDTAGDGQHEVRVLLNGTVQETWTAPVDGTYYTRTRDVTADDGDIITIESRMDTGSPPRQGLTRNRSITGGDKKIHVIAGVGERTTTEAVRYE